MEGANGANSVADRLRRLIDEMRYPGDMAGSETGVSAKAYANGDLGTRVKTIKYKPSESVLKRQIGDEIKLTEADFALLCTAFFAEIEKRIL